MFGYNYSFCLGAVGESGKRLKGKNPEGKNFRTLLRRKQSSAKISKISRYTLKSSKSDIFYLLRNLLKYLLRTFLSSAKFSDVFTLCVFTLWLFPGIKCNPGSLRDLCFRTILCHSFVPQNIVAPLNRCLTQKPEPSEPCFQEPKDRRWANGVARKWGRTDLTRFKDFDRIDFDRILTGLWLDSMESGKSWLKTVWPPSWPTPFTWCRSEEPALSELFLRN